MSEGLGVGAVVGGKYQLTRLIGEGGMGRVFEARHLQIGHRVAIKALRPAASRRPDVAARFLREAQAAAAIPSEHVVRIVDFGTTRAGDSYLVMELLDGRDLARLVAEDGPLPIARVAGLVGQACRGLDAAHRLGVVHRDLKPENLLVVRRDDGSDLLKILDFGVAKVQPAIEAAGPGGRLTAPGAAMGTLGYMAPEQLREARDIDHRADIYSVGVILYELLTGEMPYTAASLGDLVVKVANAAPVPPRHLRADLPPDLEAIVLRAMAREPEERWVDAEMMAAALAPFATAPLRPPRSVPTTHVQRGLPPADLVTPASVAAPVAAPVAARRAPAGLRAAVGLGLGLGALVGVTAFVLVAVDPFGWLGVERPQPNVGAAASATVVPQPASPTPFVAPVAPVAPAAPLAPLAPLPPPPGLPAASPLPPSLLPPPLPPLLPVADLARAAAHPCLGRWSGWLRASQGSRGSGTAEVTSTDGACGGFTERWNEGLVCRYRFAECRAEGNRIVASARALGGPTPGGGCNPVRTTLTCEGAELRLYEVARGVTVDSVMRRRSD
jgi:serine/threonine-protein kinase